MVRRAITTDVPRRIRPVLQIRMPAALLKRFRRLAASHKRTASDYGKIVVEEHLRQQSRIKR